MRFTSFEDLLTSQAQAGPEAPALRFDEDGSVSYGQLLGEAQRRAETWRERGKSCLGILCDGSYDCVCTIFGAALAGLQLVLLDGNLPESELPAALRAADVDALWGAEALETDLTPCLTGGVRDGAGKVLFFTSGTTASARPVELSQASLCASAWNGSALLPLAETDTLLCLLPLSHVFGFVCGLLWGLSCGACVALGRGARYFVQDFARFRPTAVSVVPTLLGFLLKQKALNPELGLVLIGAGDCPPALPAALRALGIRVSFGYGLTETSSGVALSLGLDPYAMTVCPDFRIEIAEDGEILVENESCMMKGYYKDPAATAAVRAGKLLRTGDLGRLDQEGLLHVTDRKKEILVFPDGTKLFLPEYEGKLREFLPGRELAVIQLPEGPGLVVQGRESERRELTQRLEPLMRQLPLARRIRALYLMEEALPRTATGKLQRWSIQKKVTAQ